MWTYMAMVRIIDVWVDTALEDVPEERRLRWHAADGFHQEHVHEPALSHSRQYHSFILARRDEARKGRKKNLT